MKANWNFSANIGFSLAFGLGVCTAVAQSSPEILWSTNAHVSAVTSVAFSGDSGNLSSGSYDEYAKVWGVSSPILIRAIYGGDEWVLTVALNSDGSLLATGGDEGHTRVWQVADGTRLWGVEDIFGIVNSVRFSPDDLYLASGLTGSLVLLADAEGRSGDYLDGQQGNVLGLAFSPDSQLVASAADDGTARIWNAAHRVVTQTVIHSNAVNSVAFSPDGTLLATACGCNEGTVLLWNLIDATVARIINGAGQIAKFSANGSLVFTLDFVDNGHFKIWRVSNGAFLGSYPNTDAKCFDVARNGKYFAYGRNDGALVLARMPLVVDSITRISNQTILTWQGGSGLYQLQRISNLGSGSWENVDGPTSSLAATNSISGAFFYRVQSLPNP